MMTPDVRLKSVVRIFRFLHKTTGRVTALSLIALQFGHTAIGAGLLSCETTPQLLKAYHVHHVKMREQSAEIKNRAVTEYLKYIDPSKNLLLKSEVDEIKKQLHGEFLQMEKRNCGALNSIHQQIIQRHKENETFVKAFVSSDKYKLDDTVEIITDPDKKSFPSSKEDREKELVKYIHFQISNYLDNGTKLPEAKKLLIHRYELITKRAQEENADDELSNFINAYASALDPHSSYFSPDVLEDFQIQMGLSLEGIGASLSSENGYTIIQEIIPGGAAARSGLLKPKDKIIAVAQGNGPSVDVIDMSLKDVVRLIRGKKGTLVSLKILRQGTQSERFDVKITRDKVNLEEQAAKFKIEKRTVGDKTLKLGVIDLPSFYGDKDRDKRSSYKDMRKLLKKARTEKLDGLLLDLSRNSGGLLDDAVKISGLFVKSGGIVATKSSDDRTEILEDTDAETVYNGPLVILTSRRSASASEILAGAMKDYKRAVIVGDDHTYGKGTVQSVLSLPLGLGALKITTGMFYLPGGKSTQREGVASDIIIPSRYDLEEFGESSTDNALPASSIASFKSDSINETPNPETTQTHWDPVSTDVVSQLVKKSDARVKASSEFKEMKTKLDEAKKSRGVVKLAELRKIQQEEEKKKSKKDKKNSKSEKSISEQIAEADLPQYNEALAILTDFVFAKQNNAALAAKAAAHP